MKEGFLNKKGVYASIVVTVLSICFLIIALLGIHWDIEGMEAVCFFALITEIFYGAIFIFKILNGKGSYDHIIPFLFLKKGSYFV